MNIWLKFLLIVTMIRNYYYYNITILQLALANGSIIRFLLFFDIKPSFYQQLKMADNT